MRNSRTPFVVVLGLFALTAAACNSSSTVSPSALPGSSGLSGSTISGQINSGSTASTLAATSSGTGAGMTVTSENAGKSTTADSSGRFTLTGLSEGRHQLRFTGSGADAKLAVSVGKGERVDIAVRVAGNNATIESERRASYDNRGPSGGDNDELEGLVSGLTGTCPSLTFKINGTTVMTNAATKFDYGICTSVANGKKVEVYGAPGSNGVVVATWVEFY
jgi:hypothetical protein